MDNMKIYNAVRAVPKEALKPITAGRLKGMSDINPMWRIQKLTEVFGACGIGWWYEITDKAIHCDEITGQKAAFVDILLYYVDPESGKVSHGIPGTGGSSLVAKEKNGPYFSDEAFKMALTDAISIAAKAIGVGADVWFAAGRSKYTAASETPEPPKEEKTETPEPICCEDCGRPITGVKVKDRLISAEEWAKGTKAEFGVPICADCRRVRKAKA